MKLFFSTKDNQMRKLIFLLSLIQTALSITINCNYKLTSWIIIEEIYTCQVGLVDLSDDPIHVTEVTGSHKKGKSNEDVHGVVFENEDCPGFNLKVIPRGFLEFFPDLILLVFRGCSITSLNGDELSEYPKLEYFSIGYSDLEKIPGNFFDHTPNMKGIIFFYNKIRIVDEGLLDNLNNLKRADFDQNPCVDISAQTPEEIQHLKEVLKENCKEITLEDLVIQLKKENDDKFKILLEKVDRISEKVDKLSESFKAHEEQAAIHNKKFIKHANQLRNFLIDEAVHL